MTAEPRQRYPNAARVFGRILVATANQGGGAPIFDCCVSNSPDGRTFWGRLLLLTPWRRDKYGESLPQRGLVVGWEARTPPWWANPHRRHKKPDGVHDTQSVTVTNSPSVPPAPGRPLPFDTPEMADFSRRIYAALRRADDEARQHCTICGHRIVLHIGQGDSSTTGCLVCEGSDGKHPPKAPDDKQNATAAFTDLLNFLARRSSGGEEAAAPVIPATEDHPAIYRDGHRLTAFPPGDLRNQRRAVHPLDSPQAAEQIETQIRNLLYLTENFGIQGIEEQERVDRAETFIAALPSIMARAQQIGQPDSLASSSPPAPGSPLGCPFCGSAPCVSDKGKEGGGWHVNCTCYAAPGLCDHNRELAIKLWNARRSSGGEEAAPTLRCEACWQVGALHCANPETCGNMVAPSVPPLDSPPPKDGETAWLIERRDGPQPHWYTHGQLCGEPMPEGESRFFYHGYSGPCPKPPLRGTSVGTADYCRKCGHLHSFGSCLACSCIITARDLTDAERAALNLPSSPESPPGDATTLDATRLIELLTIESGFWTRDVASQFAALAAALPGLIDAEKQLHRTTTALLAARDDRDEARGQVADLLVLNAGLNLELTRLRARNEELEAEIRKWRDGYSKQIVQINSLADQLHAAESRLTQLEAESAKNRLKLYIAARDRGEGFESRLTQVRQAIEALPESAGPPHGQSVVRRSAVLTTFDQIATGEKPSGEEPQ